MTAKDRLTDAQLDAMDGHVEEIVTLAEALARRSGVANVEAFAIALIGEAYGFVVARAIGPIPSVERAQEGVNFACESFVAGVSMRLSGAGRPAGPTQ